MVDRRVPPPLSRNNGTGFSRFTIEKRFPAIVKDVLRDARLKAPKIKHILRLLDEIQRGSPIDLSLFESPTSYWSECINALAGRTWNNLSFFDTEFFFYHGLNSIAQFFSDGTDVFRATRRGALLDTVAGVKGNIVTEKRIDSLAPLISRALLGNNSDYSQLDRPDGLDVSRKIRIAVDQTPFLLEAIRSRRLKQIDYIVDNAGPELWHDLFLIDGLLGSIKVDAIVVHFKPWPMFVSDALVSDGQDTVDMLIQSGAPELRGLGDRLSRQITLRRLQFLAHSAWGEPRHFSNLPHDLSQSLRASSLVIAKGDLNYRRFIEDRLWPASTDQALASSNVPFYGFSLRILKSDPVVGVSRGRQKELASADHDWRTSGRFAVVQRLGNGLPSGSN